MPVGNRTNRSAIGKSAARPLRTKTANSKTRTLRRVSAARTFTFRLQAPEARDVAVAGSFNNWALRSMRRSKNGLWSATLRIAAGIHEYKFLADHQWLEDPENPRKAPDNHGGYNSVCEVPDHPD